MMDDGAAELVIHESVDGLRLVGEIDALTTPALIIALDPLPRGDEDIDINLSDVTFIDSSGLRCLIDAHQRAEATGRRLVMSKPSTVVRRLLYISGLVPYLHVETGET